MPWHKIVLSENDVSAGTMETIQEEFTVLFVAKGAPKKAALFDEAEIPGRGTVLYLSPDAASLFTSFAQKFGATECAKPDGPLALLVGEQQALFDWQSY